MTPKDEFPVHFLVWHNDRPNLERFMASLPTDKQLRQVRMFIDRLDLAFFTVSKLLQESLEKLDPRGRTPLLLAVSMGHRECAEILLKNGADPTVESKQYWSGKLLAQSLHVLRLEETNFPFSCRRIRDQWRSGTGSFVFEVSRFPAISTASTSRRRFVRQASTDCRFLCRNEMGISQLGYKEMHKIVSFGSIFHSILSIFQFLSCQKCVRAILTAFTKKGRTFA